MAGVPPKTPRSPEARELAQLRSRGATSDEWAEVPEQLQPLLQGAWLVSWGLRMVATHSFCGGRGSMLCIAPARCTDALHQAAPAAGVLYHKASPPRNPQAKPRRAGPQPDPSAGDGAGAGLVSRLWGALGDGGGQLRFFRLSADLATLRWSWNRYVLLYHANSVTSDRWAAAARRSGVRQKERPRQMRAARLRRIVHAYASLSRPRARPLAKTGAEPPAPLLCVWQ